VNSSALLIMHIDFMMLSDLSHTPMIDYAHHGYLYTLEADCLSQMGLAQVQIT
jgi:hypothetical protein